MVTQTNGLTESLVVLTGISGVSGAGHHKVGIPAAGEKTGAKSCLKYFRNPPAIGGRHKNPGFGGGQLQRDAVPDKVKGIQKFILQFIGQHFGAVAAVSGAAEIDDHSVFTSMSVLLTV